MSPHISRPISPTWIKRGLDAAEFFAGWSKDPSTQVGAVILNAKRRVVGVGFNGFPDRVPDDPARLADRQQKNDDTIHAEVNAVLNATASVEGGALFVNYPPCGDCAKFIIQAGIAEVHYLALPADSGFGDRWACSMSRAFNIFRRAGVKVTGWRRNDTPHGVERVEGIGSYD